MTQARGSAGPHGEAHPPGTPCWVSLMAREVAGAQDFYAALFGWEFRPGPGQLGPYARAVLDGREVAGIGQLPPDRHLLIAWTPYFAAPDAGVTAELVRHCGGTVGVGPLDAGEAGRLAIASDPVGAVFGVWQTAQHTGTAITGVPGTPAWNELMTRESESVAKFYRTVFGFTEERDASAEDRLVLHVEGRPVAAVNGLGPALPRDRGPHWMPYFEVEDTDRAVDRVLTLGGRLLSPATDTAHGRVATVADTEGARFSVVRTGG